MKKIGIFFIVLLFTLISCFSSLVNAAEWGDYTKLPSRHANHSSSIDQSSDNLYLIGGSIPVNLDRKKVLFSKINDLNREWSQTLELNTPVIWTSSIFLNGYIYLFGGYNEVDNYSQNLSVDTVEYAKAELDGITAGWQTSSSNLPIKVANGAAFTREGYVYYSGGGVWGQSFGNLDIQSSIYMSSQLAAGDLSSWSDAGQLPARLLGHQLINTGKKLYLLGGYNADQSTSTGEIYEAVIDSDGKITSWIGPLANTFPDPSYKSYNFMATVVGDLVLVAGGRGPNLHDPRTYNQVFYSLIQPDGSLGPWQKSNFDLPQPTCCAGIASVGNNIFITGGHNGTTGEYFDTVWQINVSDIVSANTPTPTSSPPTPTPTSVPVMTKPLVVFIPGMSASWNYEAIVHGKSVENEKWKVPEFIDVYDELIKTLESVGYELDKDLWIYNYDWRKSVTDNGRDLKKFVLEKVLTGKSNETKVVLFGHSMGGLLARAAVDSLLLPRIDKIITFGSPHNGSAISYPVWEGADFSDFFGLQSLLIRSYLRINSIFYDSEVLAIHNLVPSIQNLLPVRNFLKNKKGVDINLNKMVWKNNLTPELNSRLSFQKNLLYTFAGTGNNTVSGYWVDTAKGKTQYGQWLDGKPFRKVYSLDGDGTVILSDAVVPEAAGTYKFPQTDHGEIVTRKQPQNTLLDILGLSQTDRIEKGKYKLYNKALVLMVGSPVNFTLTTPSGDIVLPEENLILIDDPETGEYKVNLNTIDTGSYTFYFGRINEGDEAWDEYRGISTGSGQAINLKYQVNMDVPSLGADPRLNMQEKLRKLLLELTEDKQYVAIRPLVLPQVQSLLNLVNQIDKYKIVAIKLTLANASDTYLTKLIEVTNNYQGRKLSKESKFTLVSELRQIRQDLRQFIQDLDLLPK